MNARCVEYRNRRVLGPNEQRDFGATKNDRLRATLDKPCNDATVLSAGGIEDLAQAQLVVDDAMDDLSIRVVRDQDVDAVKVLEPLTIELLLHREASAEQADPYQAGPFDFFGRRVHDMKEWDRNGFLDSRSHTVHCVCAQHETVRTRQLKRTCRLCQPAPRLWPIARVLQAFNVVKVDTVKNDLGRMEAAQPISDSFIDDTVVGNGGLPTHPADQADGSHEDSYMRATLDAGVQGASELSFPKWKVN
jgi:hypothetical protein